MLIVCAELAVVEAELTGGLLACPSCREATLGPWGYARRRVLRCVSGDRWLTPRRARCRACLATHVLLPNVCLLRRQDEVTVIGAAIGAMVAGDGYRRIAGRLGVPADTVRGWLARFADRAELLRQHFTRWAVMLDPELGAVMPAGDGIADGLEANRGRRPGVGAQVRAGGVLVGGLSAVWRVVVGNTSSRLLLSMTG